MGKTLKDIIVTTPKNKITLAAEEAQHSKDLLESGKEAFYFRTFRQKPNYLEEGSRIYYIEDGYVRGFGTVTEIVEGDMTCEVSGTNWNNGYHAIMPSDNWKWIKPISMKGFQGWRYFNVSRNNIEIIGDWLAPKPR